LTELKLRVAVQAAIRAFIVDNCPAHQQEVANAWASRVTGVGNICGFIFGYLDLPKILPFLGKTQFQVLCALASISLTVTLLASCLYIQERDPRLDGPPPSDGLGLVSFFRQVFKSIKNLPPQIARVCEVQLAAWAGWFPFLYYATTYVGQLYVNPIFADHPNMSEDQIDRTWEDATRIGTSALLAYAVISFVANIVLPLFVIPTSGQVSETTVHHDRIVYPEEEDGCDAGQSYEPLLDGTPHKVVEEKPTWLSRLQMPGLTLRRTWLLSHVLFAVCMFSTFFISSYPAGSVVIGFVGISWALTLWAPFALISAEVARADVTRRSHRRETGGVGSATEPGRAHTTASGSYAPISGEDEHEDGDRDDAEDHDLGNGDPKPTPISEEENLAQAGIVLGLHNVAVSFPQIFSSLICSAIFKAAQKPRGEPWDDSVGWVLRFGGCAALVAAWLTKRLAEGSH
jgi:solute carrier family 45 protein 1/2/4